MTTALRADATAAGRGGPAQVTGTVAEQTGAQVAGARLTGAQVAG
ncbi:MAG TPA: hypothetical protein VF256_12310 [Streptosporangiaceae bacterium]